MAKSSTGKWVSKVGASGGGKAYKKQRPSNFYGVLALIVILGLLATAYSRYEYQNPSSASTKSGPQPQIGTTWYGALGIDDCGTALPYLNADPTYKGGFTIEADNVIKISPTSASETGNNDTLSQFAAEYPGLIISSSEIAVPTATGAADTATTYKNGETCGTGTKYAGQTGEVKYAYWSSFSQTKPTITTDPTSIKLTKEVRVELAFVPANVTPTLPAQASINAMFTATQNAASTTTTTAATAATTTTVATGATTTTVAGATTTTVAPTTTTTAKG